jgi:prepilin-type N-terminal cleavage/methylation domain-containing protein
MSRNRRGFTLIELMAVITIIGILASMGMLKYMDLRATALTAAVVEDMKAVHIAVMGFHADHETWPPEAAGGQVPTGLDPFLQGPLAASFERGDYTIDYENIVVDGTPLIGVAVTTPDTRLLDRLTHAFNAYPFFMNGDRLTYLIFGPGGTF